MSLVYFSLWVIFNGRVTAEIIIAGIFISFMLDMFVKRVMKIRLTGATFWKFLKLLPDAVIKSSTGYSQDELEEMVNEYSQIQNDIIDYVTEKVKQSA